MQYKVIFFYSHKKCYSNGSLKNIAFYQTDILGLKTVLHRENYFILNMFEQWHYFFEIEKQCVK